MPHFPKPFFKAGRGVWYVEINRKQINLGPNQDEAFRQYHQLMAQPQEQPVSSESLAAIIDTFLEWVERHRSPDTYEWYRYRLQRFIERYPDLRSANLRPYHVEQWADTYPLSVTSRRNYLRSVKRCMKWAKKQGYIDNNPIEDMEVPSADQKEIVVAPDEFEHLFSYVRNQALADLITVTWQTGCRPQESLRVEARHVDLGNQRWVFRKSESKMKRITRVVYLTDTALAITKRVMLARPTGRLFTNSSGQPWTTDAVNCGFLAVQMRMGKAAMERHGEEISDDEIAGFIPKLKQTKTMKGKTVKKRPAELRCEAKRKLTYKRAAELVPRYSLYALRHSWATNALQKGLDALTVAILMSLPGGLRPTPKVSLRRQCTRGKHILFCLCSRLGTWGNLEAIADRLVSSSKVWSFWDWAATASKHGSFTARVTRHDLLTHTLVRRLSKVRRCPAGRRKASRFCCERRGTESCVGRQQGNDCSNLRFAP